MLGVIPVSCFLRNMQQSELSLVHHGLGPQGTAALAVPLVTNTFILKLNLRDNWMEGVGGAAVADMLKENSYFFLSEIDLSENQLGQYGVKAVSSMLLENTTLVSLNLSGNGLEEKAAEHLAEAVTRNQNLQHLDLSHNRLGETKKKLPRSQTLSLSLYSQNNPTSKLRQPPGDKKHWQLPPSVLPTT
uniref:Leucine rich repeat containing 74B n=1 Tax=Astyanax mexicanus TaxID=7994 RepID=A0A3B1J201_ASTMX